MLGVGISICAWVAKTGDTRGPCAGRESRGETRGRESVEEGRAWDEERNWSMFMWRSRPIQRCGWLTSRRLIHLLIWGVIFRTFSWKIWSTIVQDPLFFFVRTHHRPAFLVFPWPVQGPKCSFSVVCGFLEPSSLRGIPTVCSSSWSFCSWFSIFLLSFVFRPAGGNGLENCRSPELSWRAEDSWSVFFGT